MGKMLVKVEIDVWNSSRPSVSMKPVLRESGKTVFVQSPHKVRGQDEPVMKTGPFNKNLLGRVTSPKPGIKRSYFVTDVRVMEIRETPAYKMAVIRMMDEAKLELNTAGSNLDLMQADLMEGKDRDE